ncbi:hypothetical protein RQP46_011243 [Phenoliferia psychrophenolica]
MEGLGKLYDAHDGDTINLAEYIRLFAFDFMNEAVFSVPSGSLAAGKDVTGVMDGILGEDTETGVKFTPSQLANESFVLIIAGSDTTTAAYTLAFFYTLQTPGLYQRLREEVEQKFGSEPVTIGGTRHLPLLNGIISEAQRFMSPFPAGTGRECPKGGEMVDGVFVPGGTVVRFPSHVIHRSAENFAPDPLKFRPDRWISPEKEVALQELRYSIACTVLRWDMQLAPGFNCDKWYTDSLLDSFFFSFDDPVPVIIKKRTDGKAGLGRKA